MRHSATYIYLAVVIGLLCFFAFINKKVPGTKAQEESETQLFDLNPDDVTAVEITNDHGFFFLQKVNGHWEIKKPVDTLADGATVDGIINQISFTQPQRLLPVDGSSDKDIANLKEWGLNPPAERVVIHTKDKHYELLVGRKVAVNDSVYSRASGKKNEPVRIIPNTVKDLVEKDLSALRSRDVFSFDPAKVTKVAARLAGTSSAPGEQYEIDHKDGTWTLQLPLVARASDGGASTLLGKILGAKAVDFITDDASNLTSYGLTSPAASISVTVKADPDKPEEETVLQIGSPVPNKPDQVYAQRSKSSSVFTLTKATVDDIFKQVPNVRDLHIFPFDPAKATHLSYSVGAKKAEVRFEHALWNCLGGGMDGPADAGKVNDLLVKLSGLQTTPLLKDSAPDLRPYGLDKPTGKITIDSPEFKPGPSVTLTIGKNENKLLYVRNSAEPFVYTVPDTAFDFLPAGNLPLRDLRVVNLKNDQVKSMTITTAGAPPVNLTRSTGGTWSAANVKDRMVDSLRADTQAALFCQLQAKAWLGPVLPTYALNKPVLSISVLADQPNPTVLHIGAILADGTHAAQVEGSPTAFALSDGDYGILNVSSLQPIPKIVAPTNAPADLSPPPATNAAVGAR
jgi:hypothetical protein